LGLDFLRDKVIIGTSGFGYTDWQAKQETTKIPFYPSKLTEQQRLAWYSEVFPTVEINTSFYHFPRLQIVEKWARQVPKNFEFAFKIPKKITHEKKLIDFHSDLIRFLDTMKTGLRDKMGPALLQLPPKFSDQNRKALEVFLKHWPSDLKLAVEFREMTWIKHLDQTLNLLSKFNVAFCIVDEPLLPPIVPVTADFVYIRFHGHGLKIWYRYYYTHKELLIWKERIQQLKEKSSEIYTYFNNHPAGHAPANARQLAILLKQPLKKLETIDMNSVRKRAGEKTRASLGDFLEISDVKIEDFQRFCHHCGEIVMKDDSFCEQCGEELEKD
jgi:uncharacterized protein YecE (DUF72 family)